MDWSKSMRQTFEFVSIDPDSWEETSIINTIKSATIDVDSDTDTFYSASIISTEMLQEQYIRIYLMATQDGITERIPLATVLVQTPSSKFDGKVHDISVDSYSPLLELKDSLPPIGYTVLKFNSESNPKKILENVYDICSNNCRAPVVKSSINKELYDNFTADISENWLSFVSALVAKADCRITVDELGRIQFYPIQNPQAMAPRFTYSDDEISILQPEITIDKDIYGIPNVVEVVYSTPSGSTMYSKVINDDPSSILSTVNRGREIVYRETSPSLPGTPSQSDLDDYTTKLLKRLSCIEGTISYKHGFCPVRVGDCVYINYERAGIKDLKAVIKSQSIECSTGCQVSETAIFTDNLWEG